MVSATGPISAIGIPQKNTGALLPAKIGDATIEYIQLDDGGDTTRAVQNAKKLIQENNIDALISLGDLYRIEGLASRAQSCYEDVLKINKDNPEAKSRLAELTGKKK